MGRGWHPTGVGRLRSKPVGAGKMEAADAARLMAARAGHVVQSALEAVDRANVLQFYAVFRCLLQRANNVVFAEYGIGGCALALRRNEPPPQVPCIQYHPATGN